MGRAIIVSALAVCVMLVAGIVLGRSFIPGQGSVSSIAHVKVDAQETVAAVRDIIGSVVNENYWAQGDPIHPDWFDDHLGRTIGRVRELAPASGRKLAVRFGQGLTDGQWGNNGYNWAASFDPRQWSTSIDEIMDYIDRVGGEPYVAVNFGSGTAQDAAGLVAYANGTDPSNQFVQMRMQRGRMDPYNVQNWGVGIEQYGQSATGNRADRAYDYANPRGVNGGDPEWHGKPSSDPKNFAGRAAQFARQMRAVSPVPIRIYVPGNNWDLGYWGGPEESIKAVATGLGDLIDGVSVRFYPLNPSFGESEEDLLGRPETLAEKLDLLRNLLERYGPPGRSLEIADVEYNNRSPSNDQSHQLVNGLFVADTLRVLATREVSSAFYFAISVRSGDKSGFSYFEEGNVDKLMPSYLSTQLMARHLGATVVRSDVAGSKIVQAGGGKMGAFEYPTMTALSSLSLDRKTLYLVVINKHLRLDQKAEIELDGVKTAGETQVTALTGFSPYARAEEVSLSQSARRSGNSFSYNFPAHSVTGFAIPLSATVP